MSDKEFEEIIAAIAIKNDDLAFKKLYYFYFNKLFYQAISIVGSAEEAEEVVNDTFLSIWKNREQLQQVRSFKTYIYTAVRNKAINALARIRPYEHFDPEGTEAVHYIACQNAEDKINADELARILDRSVEKLPAQSRLIFRLVKEHDLKHKEVAELLDLSVKSVEYHIGSALKKIWETYVGSYGGVKKRNVKK